MAMTFFYIHNSALETAGPDRRTRPAMKFSSVEGAAEYVNSQLVLKGFLRQDTQLQFDSTVDDKRLLINTLNKLLGALEHKNEQINELHSKLAHTPPAEALRAPRQELQAERQSVPKPAKIVKIIRRAPSHTSPGADSLAKQYKVKLQKLQSTVDGLRHQMQLERSRKNSNADLTWEITQDMTTTTLPRQEDHNPVVAYREEVSSLLESEARSHAVEEQMTQFVETVNRYTYSLAIMGIRDLKLSTDVNFFKDLPSSELKELINDWYEIVSLSQQQ